VIVVAALLLLVAVGLLAGGLAQGSATLQWGSFAASALAAVVLALGEVRRRRSAARQPAPARAVASERPGTATTGRAAVAAGSSGLPGTVVAPADAARSQPEPAPEPDPVPEAAAPRAVAFLPPVPTGVDEPVGPTTGAHAAVRAESAVPAAPRSVGAHSAEQPAAPALGEDGEPPVEEVEVTDLLLVLDLTDEVLVVDEHPRYHLADCPHLVGEQTFPVPMDEARTDGFTPCATCAPDRHLAERERSRRG
jgi:hypothetical protein